MGNSCSSPAKKGCGHGEEGEMVSKAAAAVDWEFLLKVFSYSPHGGHTHYGTVLSRREGGLMIWEEGRLSYFDNSPPKCCHYSYYCESTYARLTGSTSAPVYLLYISCHVYLSIAPATSPAVLGDRYHRHITTISPPYHIRVSKAQISYHAFRF